MPETSILPPRRGFRAFVERHDALFTTLGALIVFLGFYMKEVVLDRASSLDATLKTSRANYLLNQQLQSISAQLVPVQTTVTELQNYGPNSSPIHDIYVQIGTVTQTYDALQDDFSLTEQLLHSLPFQSKPLLDTASTLHQAIPSMTGTEKSLIDLRDQVIKESAKSITEIRDRGSYQELVKTAGNFFQSVDTFTHTVTKFKNDVDAEGSRQLKTLDDQASTADNWSKVLFVFGWILGFLGKLLKLPALGGGGE